jgi:hypothetical protein
MEVEAIQAKKEYTAAEINTLRIFPWTHCTNTVSRWINRDFFGENMLKARIEGSGRSTRYYVLGKELINYKKKYETMLMQNSRTPRQTWIKKQRQTRQ